MIITSKHRLFFLAIYVGIKEINYILQGLYRLVKACTCSWKKITMLVIALCFACFASDYSARACLIVKKSVRCIPTEYIYSTDFDPFYVLI